MLARTLALAFAAAMAHADDAAAAKVYKCDFKKHQCHEVPAGTAGAISLALCDEQCGIATPTPTAPPTPPPATPVPGAAKVYQCSMARQQCKVVPAGTAGATSLAVCDKACGIVTPAPTVPPTPVPEPTAPLAKVYKCNEQTEKCEEAAPFTAGSSSLDVCEKACGQATLRVLDVRGSY